MAIGWPACVDATPTPAGYSPAMSDSAPDLATDPTAALRAYETEASGAIAAAADADALESARVTFLGKKQGRLKDLQKVMGTLSKDDRPAFGKTFNEVKNRIESLLADRQATLAQPKRQAAGLDITLPGEPLRLGRRHPITQTIDQFLAIFARFGFTPIDGPEIEDEWHNFDALNISPSHPARDPLDNFYLEVAGRAAEELGEASVEAAADVSGDASPVLLRSQTSSVQIRVMEQQPPPIRIVSVGRVYRPDTIDATHSCMFHQIEGLMVGDAAQPVTMASLKTVLSQFAAAYFGPGATIRFRPSFFPFTEPSVEVDLQFGGGWMEIGGAGMVDPAVFEAVGYDPDQVTGFAFGLGVERFCMGRHNITDIRRLYENDVRFLRQF